MFKKILRHPFISILLFIVLASMLLTINKYKNISYKVINDVELRPKAFTVDKYNLIVNNEIIGIIDYESWQLNKIYMWGSGLYLKNSKNKNMEFSYFINHKTNSYFITGDLEERLEFRKFLQLVLNEVQAPLETISDVIYSRRKYDHEGNPLSKCDASFSTQDKGVKCYSN